MIVFARVDDRLVHGQVATTGVRACSANRIYIVDDTVAADNVLISLYKGLAPQGTRVVVWDVATACTKVALVAQHPQIKGFVLCKSPVEFLRMSDAGIPFDKICVGNMAPKDGRIQLQAKRNTWATAEERDAFRALAQRGIDVYIQHTPEQSRVPILKADGMRE